MRTNLSSQFDAAQRQAWRPKIVARNTFRFEREGETVIRLHGTDIVRKRADGSVILDSGGWKTVTTKERMRGYLPAGVRLESTRGAWHLVKFTEECRWDKGNPRVPFFDGIEVPACFASAKIQRTAGKVELAETKLRKQISAFVAESLPDGKPYPAPHAGDCWICMFDRAKLEAKRDGCKPDGYQMGGNDLDGDASHIREHVREKYFHGSLLLNALIWRGYPNPGLCWQLWDARRMRGILRQYLNARLGLAR